MMSSFDQHGVWQSFEFQRCSRLQFGNKFRNFQSYMICTYPSSPSEDIRNIDKSGTVCLDIQCWVYIESGHDLEQCEGSPNNFQNLSSKTHNIIFPSFINLPTFPNHSSCFLNLCPHSSAVFWFASRLQMENRDSFVSCNVEHSEPCYQIGVSNNFEILNFSTLCAGPSFQHQFPIQMFSIFQLFQIIWGFCFSERMLFRSSGNNLPKPGIAAKKWSCLHCHSHRHHPRPTYSSAYARRVPSGVRHNLMPIIIGGSGDNDDDPCVDADMMDVNSCHHHHHPAGGASQHLNITIVMSTMMGGHDDGHETSITSSFTWWQSKQGHGVTFIFCSAQPPCGLRFHSMVGNVSKYIYIYMHY